MKAKKVDKDGWRNWCSDDEDFFHEEISAAHEHNGSLGRASRWCVAAKRVEPKNGIGLFGFVFRFNDGTEIEVAWNEADDGHSVEVV